MGIQDVGERGGSSLRTFMQAVLEDLQGLERMIDSGMIERGVRRIGAEQELFLVDDAWQPLPRQSEVLAALADAPGSYTPELARFNIEANLQPHPLSGRCLSDMHMELESLVMNARAAAQEADRGSSCAASSRRSTRRTSASTAWPTATVTGS